MSDGQVYAWCAFVVVAALVGFGWGVVFEREGGHR
jgi:hypothetical protein